MGTGHLVVLVVLPLAISILAQVVLGRRHRPLDDTFARTRAAANPAEVLATAGLGLLVERPAVSKPAPRQQLRVIEALATVGGSLLVKRPEDVDTAHIKRESDPGPVTSS